MTQIQATDGDTATNGKQSTDYTPFYFAGALFLLTLMVGAPLWLISTKGGDPNLVLLIGLVETPLGLALAQIWGFIQTAESRKETASLARKQDKTHELVNHGTVAATETLKRVSYLEGRLEERDAQVLQAAKDEARRVAESNAEFVRAAAARTVVAPVQAVPGALSTAIPPAFSTAGPTVAPASAEPVQSGTIRVVAPIAIEVVTPPVPPIEDKPSARYAPPEARDATPFIHKKGG